MPKPPCHCTGRTDIRCDAEHCDLAAPPQEGKHQGCVICWQYHHSPEHRALWDGVQPVQKAPAPIPPPAPPPAPVPVPPPVATEPQSAGVIRFGDRVEQALSLVGITKERYAAWTGQVGNCLTCVGRQQKLNELSQAVEEAITGSIDKAKSLFGKLFGG